MKMKLFLQTILCFAFAVTVFGQDYGRRRQRPVVKPKVVHPKPLVQKPPITSFGGGFDPTFDTLDTLRGGGMRDMPDEIRRIIGSTVSGNVMVGGEFGLPRHGGTLNENGLVGGWGTDPNVPFNSAVSMWNDPLNGAQFPENYNGEELVFDERTGRYVIKETGHQIAKETHVAAKTGGIITVGVPSGHNTVKTEHNIAKEATHVARKTMAGVPEGVGGFGSPIGVAPISHGHNIAKETNHVARKSMAGVSGGVGGFGTPIGVAPISHGHNIVKETNHVARKSMAGVSGGVGGFGTPIGVAPISHGHNIVQEANHVARKSMAGVPGGVGGFGSPIGVAPISHGHNIFKETNHVAKKNMAGVPGAVGGGVAPISHDINKQMNIRPGQPFESRGDQFFGTDPFGQMPSDNFFAGGPVNSARHVGVSQLGPVNVGHVGIDAPEVIAHNVGKATLGVDAVAGHNVAKASGTPIGIGFLNPSGPITPHRDHDISRGTSGVIFDQFNQDRGMSGGIGLRPTFGPIGNPSNPVHNVHKVGKSGLASKGHDQLAATLGHGLAKQAVGEAAQAIDFGSQGGVSGGNPIALGATHNLAKESLHVAGKTMGIASSGVVGRRHIAPGMSIFDQGSMMVHPKPVHKPPPKITGYGRRRKD